MDEQREQRAMEIATCTTLNYHEALHYVTKLHKIGVSLNNIPAGTREFMDRAYRLALRGERIDAR